MLENRHWQSFATVVTAGILSLLLSVSAGGAGSFQTTAERSSNDPAAHERLRWAADDDDFVQVSNEAVVNDNPAFVQLYNNNVENLLKVDDEGCSGDWKDLIHYMNTREYTPDLFLVQQISNSTQLNELTSYMNEHLSGDYAGVIAVEEPEEMNVCKNKTQQTNAIIYRTGRFNLVDSSTWQSSAQPAGGGPCDGNNQDRTINVRAKLYDEVAERHLTVASVHWPTNRSDDGQPNGPACAAENVREADARINAEGYGGELRIFGGDFNVVDIDWGRESESYLPWYEQANGDVNPGGLNYRDAIYDDCAERNTGLAIKYCLAENWTFESTPKNPDKPVKQHRIDFVFAQGEGGTLPFVGAEATVTFNAADKADNDQTDNGDNEKNYSEHRAIMARIHYPGLRSTSPPGLGHDPLMVVGPMCVVRTSVANRRGDDHDRRAPVH